MPSCGTCRACAAGRANLCETVLPAAWAGTLLDGTSRLRLADGAPLMHFNFVSCFAEHCVVPAASAVPLPDALPLWQAALVGCAVVTGVGAVRNAARVAPGETVCVIGCGGVGLQIVAGAALAGAGRIVAVDRDPAKLALAAARGATDAVPAGPEAVAAVLALVPGGVDHAFEAVGQPATIRQAWDVLRPGATAIVVGIARLGAEVSLPALELLSEKGLRGSYYGSAHPAEEIGALARPGGGGRAAARGRRLARHRPRGDRGRARPACGRARARGPSRSWTRPPRAATRRPAEARPRRSPAAPDPSRRPRTRA